MIAILTPAEQAEIEQCHKEIDEFKGRLLAHTVGEGAADSTEGQEQPLAEYVKQNGGTTAPLLRLQCRRTLKGHFGKIYALQWNKDGRHLVSASQDGKLLVWNAFTTNKVHAISLRSSWVMSCGYSSDAKYTSCGGLDNMVTIYKLPEIWDGSTSPIVAELMTHTGYVSGCKFMGERQLLSSSGDRNCILWDIETKTPLTTFSGHGGDVMSVTINEGDHLFVSGSVDCSAKLWDYRLSAKQACVKTFLGHESDINAVDYFPDGNSFATASDDSSLRLYDIRAWRQMNKYANDKILCGITSCAFSKSGSILFAGYDDANCQGWDTLSGLPIDPVLSGHDNRVSCVGVGSDGKALATGSWDLSLKIWA